MNYDPSQKNDKSWKYVVMGCFWVFLFFQGPPQAQSMSPPRDIWELWCTCKASSKICDSSPIVSDHYVLDFSQDEKKLTLLQIERSQPIPYRSVPVIVDHQIVRINLHRLARHQSRTNEDLFFKELDLLCQEDVSDLKPVFQSILDERKSFSETPPLVERHSVIIPLNLTSVEAKKDVPKRKAQCRKDLTQGKKIGNWLISDSIACFYPQKNSH